MTPGRKRLHIDPGRAAVTRRLTIPMPFVHEEDHDAAGRRALIFVEPSDPLWLRRIAERMAHCFTRSTPFDGGIYSARDPNTIVVVLLPMSNNPVGDGSYYSGAIGVRPATRFSDGAPLPVAQWFWVHPFDRVDAGHRGESVVEQHWPKVLDRWPDLMISGPFTRAGRALAKHLDAPIVPGTDRLEESRR